MNSRPAQKDINDAEWHNRDNWRGPRWLGIYASSRDSRAFVPKYPRLLGYTLNFGHPSARWFIAAIVAVGVLSATIIFMIERQ